MGFDLMLSDVVMPNMDGHELYLKVQELYPKLPVLMMTAFHYDKDHIIKRSRIEEAAAAQVEDYASQYETLAKRMEELGPPQGDTKMLIEGLFKEQRESQRDKVTAVMGVLGGLFILGVATRRANSTGALLGGFDGRWLVLE